MTNPTYRPLPDGVYDRNGSIITVGNGNNLSISKKQRRMYIWVGELPDGWKLCEAVDGLTADWSQAPEWAMWWAVDADERAYWHEKEPEIGSVGFIWRSAGTHSYNHHFVELPLGIDWRTLKQRRPEKTDK